MLGLQPAVVGAAQAFEWSQLNHDVTLRATSALLHTPKMGCRIGE